MATTKFSAIVSNQNTVFRNHACMHGIQNPSEHGIQSALIQLRFYFGRCDKSFHYGETFMYNWFVENELVIADVLYCILHAALTIMKMSTISIIVWQLSAVPPSSRCKSYDRT